VAKLAIAAGSTSVSLYVFVADSASTTGGGKTGIAHNASGFTAYYVRNRGSATAITLASLASATAAYSSGGWFEVDATNMPGVYRFDVPDAALASGSRNVVFYLRGAAGMAPLPLEVDLDAEVDVTFWRGTQPNALASNRVDVVVGAYGSGLTPLQPTVAGRTLDVSAGGEAGIDWANVGSPTTAVNLSGTTISTGQAVASVSGAVGTVTDKSGYSLTQSFPANFASMSIDGSGRVLLQPTQAGVTIPTVTALTNAPSDSNGVTTLLTRLSTTRAGYLDNLSGGAVATQASLNTVVTAAAKLDTALELDGAVYRFTANALELAPTGGGSDPWAATMETGVTYAQAMRGVFAVTQGDSVNFAAGASTGVVFKSADGTKSRVTSNVDADGNRTVTARDLT
jgi:hypothetical protein